MATISESAFRAYDIRGVIGKEITPEFMHELGRAFVSEFKVRDVVVGYDARPSSKEYLPHLMRGMTEQGANVHLVGLVPSEVVIATAGLQGIEHAAIITASHNPAEYVGVKLYTETSVQIAAINYQSRLKECLARGIYPDVAKSGNVIEVDPWPGYVKHILTVLDLPPLRRRRVLADAGNGTGGLLMQHLAPHLNLEVDPLYFEPDGTYPNHVPNPLVPENRQDAERRAKAGLYDFSILLDGDADRIIFLDENGDYISGDFTGTLIADEVIQKKHPKSPVIIDLRRGWVLQDSAQAHGYEAIATMAGNPYLKHAMRKHNSAFGFEASAHNFYKDFFNSDSAGVTLIFILYLLETTGKSLSELIAPYREGHVMIDEINYIHPKAAEALAAIEAYFKDALFNRTDGLSVGYPTWHANLRSSNTEPLIRLNLEARDQATLESMTNEMHQVIEASGGQRVHH